jgi:hypothetical protein
MRRIIVSAIAWMLLAATAHAQPGPGSTAGAFFLDVTAVAGSTTPPPRIVGHTFRGSCGTCTVTSTGIRCP